MGFAKAAYVLAVGQWGIQPSEYWAMALAEWVWLFDVKKPARSQEWAGRMTDADVMACSQALDEALANEQNRKRPL